MSNTEQQREPFAHQLRIRVCGLVVRKDRLLMVKMRPPTRDTSIWMPPGGGVEHGESARDALKREMAEETGIRVSVGALRYVHEFLESPYHALELYFDCHYESGELKLGGDPELDEHELPPMLQDLRFMPIHDLRERPVEPAFLREDYPRTYRLKPTGPGYYEQGREVTNKP